MKTKITISILLCLLVFAFGYKKEEIKETKGTNIIKPSAFPPSYEDISPVFLRGVMDGGWDIYDENEGYEHLQALNLNLWHKYTSAIRDANDVYKTDAGWDVFHRPSTEDLLGAAVNEQLVGGKILENMTTGMRTLMDRPTFNMLCYGQRSDYQCEDISKVEQDDPDRNFYTFQSPSHAGMDMRDGTSHGDNQWVRFCEYNPVNQPEVYPVESRLRTNNEQVRCDVGNALTGDARSNWLIKPRIRIEPEDANANIRVCSLIVKRYDGQEILNVLIKGNHFLSASGYDGSYIEEYFFEPNEPKLEILPLPSTDHGNKFSPDPNDPWPFSSRGNRTSDGPDDNKMDIEVYWFNECDMYIDYVRVDNDIAHRLLKPGGDDQFELWIERETEHACKTEYSNNPLKFYIEEFEFNNIPCMAYVNEKIKSIRPSGSKISLMCDLNYPAYNAHLWYSAAYLDAGHISRQLVEEAGLSQIFGGPYPFLGSSPNYELYMNPNTAYVSYISNKLPTHSGSMVFAEAISPSLYDKWLNEDFDDPGKPADFSNYLKTMSEVSQLSHVPYLNIFGTHLWKSVWEGGAYYQREPTNEEITMMANVILSYGAKGLLYFTFTSNGEYSENFVGRGLMEPGTPPTTRRDNNVYDQWENGAGTSKFITVAAINGKLRDKWGPALMSFDNSNRHSYIYRLENERTALLRDSYFMDVVSYVHGWDLPDCQEDAPDTTGDNPPEDISYECNEDRYLQVATFKTTPDDGNEYFMIVNRRCSPYIDESSVDNIGGQRFIRVKI